MIFVALVGLTLILVRGTIFRPLQRVWPALFRCSQCMGMWIGLAAGAGGIASVDHGHGVDAVLVGRIVDAVLVGAATSVLSIGTDAVLLKLLGDPDEEKVP